MKPQGLQKRYSFEISGAIFDVFGLARMAIAREEFSMWRVPDLDWLLGEASACEEHVGWLKTLAFAVVLCSWLVAAHNGRSAYFPYLLLQLELCEAILLDCCLIQSLQVRPRQGTEICNVGAPLDYLSFLQRVFLLFSSLFV